MAKAADVHERRIRARAMKHWREDGSPKGRFDEYLERSRELQAFEDHPGAALLPNPMALHHGDLGELNLSSRIVPLLDHLGHRRELRLVTPLPSGVEGERHRKIVKTVGIKRLDRAHRLVAPVALGRRRRCAEG